jgi:acyl carrier protein
MDQAIRQGGQCAESESRDVALRARGLVQARMVGRRADAGPVATLVLLVAPDFDLVEACGEIWRAYEVSWPPIVVLTAPAEGTRQAAIDEVLAQRVDHIVRGEVTAGLRRAFLAAVGEVLERADVSEDHYFFVEAAGDSIAALQLSAAVEERFGFELPLEVLSGLTIGRIADLLATTHLAARH